MAFPVSDLTRQALRNGATITYTVAASHSGVPVAGATDLRPTGGSISDTSRAGVRRVLNLELAPEPGLFDTLSPIGTTLAVTAHIRFTDRTVVDIPMGVFGVDSEKLSEGGGSLSLTAPDRWAEIQRARFVVPQSSTAGITVVDQIVNLIRTALGLGEQVNVTATSKAKVGALVWEKDRDKAIMDLAAGIGAWVFFDRNGIATVADLPTSGKSADWLLDASASGVLVELDRERSRSQTRNVIVVESSASDGAKFPTQYVWDDDVNSPTYAGSNPITSPGTAGPFGIVTYYYDTPLPLTGPQAWAAGRAILARVSGLASSVSASQVPNPAVDALDVLDVLPPAKQITSLTLRTVDQAGSLSPAASLYPGVNTFPSGGRQVPVLTRSSTGAVLERHMADTVTHPLTLGAAQQIEGRSTRTEEIEGGS